MASKVSELDGSDPDSTDFANYFCAYAYLYHQKDMLADHKRTGAYHSAICNNRHCFEGRTVLDVGTGSGILAIFAAQSGAKKVYAVEATDMAKFAKKLVEANGMSDVIEVIKGTIETVTLPCKVDIIISEWMGYFLMRESMLDSVIVARDRFLCDGGAMYPSHARILMTPIRTQLTEKRANEHAQSMVSWSTFVCDVREYYDVDLSCMTSDYELEQREYLLQTACWSDVHPGNVLGLTGVVKTLDLATVSLEEVKAPIVAEFEMLITRPGPVEGFAGYFDTAFRGSESSPAQHEVLLTTAPDSNGATHWGQMTFQVHPHIQASPGDVLLCKLEMARQDQNSRLLHVRLDISLRGDSANEEACGVRKLIYKID